MSPDPWQVGVLESTAQRMALLTCRQAGKSTVAAALAVLTALLEAPALILLVSPGLRQSQELFRKVVDLYTGLKSPVAINAETALRLELVNGSRIVASPGAEDTVRGYSKVSLLLVDEASRVPDALFYTIRPMLAVSRGRLVAMTTPAGKRGWFYDGWESGQWEQHSIKAEHCPRIDPEFLAEERAVLGPRFYRQEYECSFEDEMAALFSSEDIEAARTNDPFQPLFAPTMGAT